MRKFLNQKHTCFCRALNFSENREFTITNLLTVVLNCRGLEELQITKIKATENATELNDHDVSFIIANMSSDLKTLVLDSSNLTNSTFEVTFFFTCYMHYLIYKF